MGGLNSGRRPDPVKAIIDRANNEYVSDSIQIPNLSGVQEGAKKTGGATLATFPSQAGHSGEVLTTNGTSVSWTSAASGDMLASTYDPTSVSGDAFDMDNMTQGSTNYFISSAEKTVLDNTSGTNTGDQTLSGLGGVPTSRTINTHALTANITLDPDDLDDTSTTNKFTTASDISKLSGIETGADVTDSTNVISSLSGQTLTGALEAADHGTATTDQIVNVCYGTSATPPTASTTTEGTIYIQYTA